MNAGKTTLGVWIIIGSAAAIVFLTGFGVVFAFAAMGSLTREWHGYTGGGGGTGGGWGGGPIPTGSCTTNTSYFASGDLQGGFSSESHLVTVEDFSQLGGWPNTGTAGIPNHLNNTNFTTLCSGCSTTNQEWTPAKGGGKIGQGSSSKPPASAEPWVVNVRCTYKQPEPGEKLIVKANGKAVVAAGGYECGPNPSTGNIGGGQIEVLHYLGISHGSQVTIGFASDQNLSYGPINCQ